MKNKKSISYRIYSKKNLKMAEEKTTLLGVNNKLDAVDLLNIRLFISVVVFISILYFIDFGYFIAPLVSFLVYQLFFPIVVDTKIEKRRKILEKDSLYFFEILVLSLEAGRNIKNAIEVTTMNIDSELSDEFKKVIKDVNFGKDLDTATLLTRSDNGSLIIADTSIDLCKNSFGYNQNRYTCAGDFRTRWRTPAPARPSAAASSPRWRT